METRRSGYAIGWQGRCDVARFPSSRASLRSLRRSQQPTSPQACTTPRLGHPPPEHAPGPLPLNNGAEALPRKQSGFCMPSQMQNPWVTVRGELASTKRIGLKTPQLMCHRCNPAGFPAHRAQGTSLPACAHARTRHRAAGSASRRPALRTPSRRDLRPLALRARLNKGDAAGSVSCGSSEPGPRSPGLRPRLQRRLLGWAPAARAWRRWRQSRRPP